MKPKFQIKDIVALSRKPIVKGMVVGIYRPISDLDGFRYDVSWDEIPSRIADRSEVPEDKLQAVN